MSVFWPFFNELLSATWTVLSKIWWYIYSAGLRAYNNVIRLTHGWMWQEITANFICVTKYIKRIRNFEKLTTIFFIFECRTLLNTHHIFWKLISLDNKDLKNSKIWFEQNSSIVMSMKHPFHYREGFKKIIIIFYIEIQINLMRTKEESNIFVDYLFKGSE